MTVIVLPRGKVSPYRTERIPKKATADTEEQHPGKLCWGDAGEMPPLVPTGLSFNVDFPEEHIELSRETEPVKIYNEDGSSFIEADRTKQLIFEKKNNKDTSTSSNTSTGGEDFGDFAPSDIELTQFKPLGTASKKDQLKVTFKNEGSSL